MDKKGMQKYNMIYLSRIFKKLLVYKQLTLFLITFFCFFLGNAQVKSIDSIISFDGHVNELISQKTYVLLDTHNKMEFNDVINSPDFKRTKNNVPNLGSSTGSAWLKFTIKNNSTINKFLLEIENAFLEKV